MEWSLFLSLVSIDYMPVVWNYTQYKCVWVYHGFIMQWEKECPLPTTGDCWPSQTEQRGWKYM